MKCSRCGSRGRNPSCYVCCTIAAEEPPAPALKRDTRNRKEELVRTPWEMMEEAQVNVAHFRRMVAITDGSEKNLYSGLLRLWEQNLAKRQADNANKP